MATHAARVERIAAPATRPRMLLQQAAVLYRNLIPAGVPRTAPSSRGGGGGGGGDGGVSQIRAAAACPAIPAHAATATTAATGIYCCCCRHGRHGLDLAFDFSCVIISCSIHFSQHITIHGRWRDMPDMPPVCSSIISISISISISTSSSSSCDFTLQTSLVRGWTQGDC